MKCPIGCTNVRDYPDWLKRQQTIKAVERWRARKENPEAYKSIIEDIEKAHELRAGLESNIYSLHPEYVKKMDGLAVPEQVKMGVVEEIISELNQGLLNRRDLVKRVLDKQEPYIDYVPMSDGTLFRSVVYVSWHDVNLALEYLEDKKIVLANLKK